MGRQSEFWYQHHDQQIDTNDLWNLFTEHWSRHDHKHSSLHEAEKEPSAKPVKKACLAPDRFLHHGSFQMLSLFHHFLLDFTSKMIKTCSQIIWECWIGSLSLTRMLMTALKLGVKMPTPRPPRTTVPASVSCQVQWLDPWWNTISYNFNHFACKIYIASFEKFVESITDFFHWWSGFDHWHKKKNSVLFHPTLFMRTSDPKKEARMLKIMTSSATPEKSQCHHQQREAIGASCVQMPGVYR